MNASDCLVDLCARITVYCVLNGLYVPMTRQLLVASIWIGHDLPCELRTLHCMFAVLFCLLHDILFVVMMQAFETETLFIVRVGVAMCIKVGRLRMRMGI